MLKSYKTQLYVKYNAERELCCSVEVFKYYKQKNTYALKTPRVVSVQSSYSSVASLAALDPSMVPSFIHNWQPPETFL